MLTLKKQDYQKIFEGILVTEESKLNFFETFFDQQVVHSLTYNLSNKNAQL